MKNIKYPVECPLMEKEIDEYTCFEIHSVVDDNEPRCVAPKNIFKHENYVEICRNCKYHRQ